MTMCLFLTFRCVGEAPIAQAEVEQLDILLRNVPGLEKALVHTSSSASDPYVKDENAPSLVLQAYFKDLPGLEASISHVGAFAALASRTDFPSLSSADVTQQAMVARSFTVPEPKLQNPAGAPYCTYLVAYEGEAEDLNAWHSHYLEHHTKHMARFPGLRELEVYTRLDWVSGLPWRRINFMQRNKVAFDSPQALTAALHSPVRHEMRADFRAFPPFSGSNTHYAMATRVVRPAN